MFRFQRKKIDRLREQHGDDWHKMIFDLAHNVDDDWIYMTLDNVVKIDAMYGVKRPRHLELAGYPIQTMPRQSTASQIVVPSAAESHKMLSRGLGDSVKKGLERVGIRQKRRRGRKCGGCSKRQRKMNNAAPYSPAVAQVLNKVGL